MRIGVHPIMNSLVDSPFSYCLMFVSGGGVYYSLFRSSNCLFLFPLVCYGMATFWRFLQNWFYLYLKLWLFIYCLYIGIECLNVLTSSVWMLLLRSLGSSICDEPILCTKDGKCFHPGDVCEDELCGWVVLSVCVLVVYYIEYGILIVYGCFNQAFLLFVGTVYRMSLNYLLCIWTSNSALTGKQKQSYKHAVAIVSSARYSNTKHEKRKLGK
jgi:hypothetical protein